MTTKTERPPDFAPEMESWPVIYFSRKERKISTGEKEAIFNQDDPYHRKHWDVLNAFLEGELAPSGEPVLSTNLKKHINRNRPPGSEIMDIAPSLSFIRGRIEKDPKNPTILITEGSGQSSATTLRARVRELDAPEDREEKEAEKEVRTLIPYSDPPKEIDLSFLGNEKVAVEQLIERLEEMKKGVNVSLTTLLLSRVVNNIRGERVSLTRNAYEILNAVCPDIEERNYSTIINKQKFLKIITGHEEGPEMGIYIVAAVDETLDDNWDRPQNPGFLLGGGKGADMDRNISILKAIEATRGQVIIAVADHLGVETPKKYGNEKPHPKIRLYEKEQDGYAYKRQRKAPFR